MLRNWLARRFLGAAAVMGGPRILMDAEVSLGCCDCGCGLAFLKLCQDGEEIVVGINRHTAADLGDALVSHAVRVAEDG